MPQRISLARSSPSLLAVLGVTPALGGAFAEDSVVPGNDHVILLSHRLWTTRYAARGNIVGENVRLDDELFRIVGVMPEGFGFPDREVDAGYRFLTRSRSRAMRDFSTRTATPKA